MPMIGCISTGTHEDEENEKIVVDESFALTKGEDDRVLSPCWTAAVTGHTGLKHHSTTVVPLKRY